MLTHGLEKFKEYFIGFENQYVLIGGTACSILFDEFGSDFRTTKDIDMVLIVEALTKELRNEFDTKKRSDLAVKIQQEVLNDCGYTYASHLKMSFVMKNNVKGFEAHPSDFYEITANTDIE